MTSLNVIENKISFIQEQLKILQSYKKYNLKRILDDYTLKGAVERYLYLAIQATIDLADAMIALKKLRKPTTYRESFYILKEEKIIPAKLQEVLVNMTGFRNRIAHAYEKIDHDKMYEILHNDLGDITKFVNAVKKKLNI